MWVNLILSKRLKTNQIIEKYIHILHCTPLHEMVCLNESKSDIVGDMQSVEIFHIMASNLQPKQGREWKTSNIKSLKNQ